MARKIEEKLTKKEIEKLLKEQTRVILDAVDEKVSGLEKKIAKLEIKMERRFDQLITTLDKFLKRLTDLEDEFTVMKAEIRKIKEVLKEKLGVEIE
jgi:predicted  nucleic acid-binding Zn-ribbon protein